MSIVLDKAETIIKPLLMPLDKLNGSLVGAVILAAIAIVGMRGGLPVVLQDSVLFKAFSLVVMLYGYSGKFVQSAVIVGAVLVAYNYFVAKSDNKFELYTDLYAPTVVPEQCREILFADILAAYKNDMDHLLDDLVQAGVPKNVKLNNEYAPLIATYLLKLGTDVCVKA